MKIELILYIFLIGIIILFSAIIINFLANFFKINTWYSFLDNLLEKGLINTIKKESFLSLLYLFIIYPLFLGIISYYSYILLLK
jgi:hypothetical protein